ncbi:MAG: hypothetical protein GYA33_06195, partial [Thermogutta sp.]|nr:hypothetical protein [Thermogutta sp.]
MPFAIPLRRWPLLALGGACLGLLILGFSMAGCSKPGGGPSASDTPAAPAAAEQPTNAGGESQPGSEESAADASAQVTLRDVDPEALTAQLREANPRFHGTAVMEKQGGETVVAVNDPAVIDIKPLAGLRIHKLDLFQCGVEDLTPLKGLPLTALAIDRTRVVDLAPLQGMPLEYLSASET